MPQNNGKQDLFKTLGVAALAVIAFAVIYNLFLGGRSGFGFNMGLGMHNGMYGGMYGGYGAGSDINSLIASILSIAVQLLWIIFVIGLVVGAVLFFKKHVFEDKKIGSILDKFSNAYNCPCCNTKLTADFKFCPNCKASLKEVCSKCGRELQAGWGCCPICGTEKGTESNSKTKSVEKNNEKK